MGIYPLGITKVRSDEQGYDTNIRKAVNRLFKFDKKTTDRKRGKKRPHQEDKIELRNGKKIKIVPEFRQQIAENYRKQDEIPPISAKKKKNNKKEIDISDLGTVESIFKRNSGLWFVTVKQPKENQEEFVSPKKTRDSPTSLNLKGKKSPRAVFPKWESWENTPELTVDLGDSTISVDQNQVTSAKKVKININLNQSQEISEHVAQILSSPAIPYDANKKPAKPLLKTPSFSSPINPFY